MGLNYRERRELMWHFICTKCFPEMEAKGPDYAGGEDKEVNSNFRDVAALFDNKFDDIDVWWVYFLKHLLALKTWIVTRTLKSETLRGRLMDLINYLLILYTQLVDKGIIEKPNQLEMTEMASHYPDVRRKKDADT